METWEKIRNLVLIGSLAFLGLQTAVPVLKGAARLRYNKETIECNRFGSCQLSVTRVDDRFNLTTTTRYPDDTYEYYQKNLLTHLLLHPHPEYSLTLFDGGFHSFDNYAADGEADVIRDWTARGEIDSDCPTGFYYRNEDFDKCPELFLKSDELLASARKELEEHFDF